MTSETLQPRSAEKYDLPLIIVLPTFADSPEKEFPTNFDASGGSSAFNNGMLGVGVKSS